MNRRDMRLAHMKMCLHIYRYIRPRLHRRCIASIARLRNCKRRVDHYVMRIRQMVVCKCGSPVLPVLALSSKTRLVVFSSRHCNTISGECQAIVQQPVSRVSRRRLSLVAFVCLFGIHSQPFMLIRHSLPTIHECSSYPRHEALRRPASSKALTYLLHPACPSSQPHVCSRSSTRDLQATCIICDST